MDLELCREAAVSNDYEDLIVRYTGQPEILEESKADCWQKVSDEYAVLYYRVAGENTAQSPFVAPQSGTAQGNPAYTYSQLPKCYGLMQSPVLEEIGVSRLRRQQGFDYFGQDVIIGFVDTGIDYTHPVFLQADGTSRVRAIWDQENQDGTPPEGFLFGTEFTEAEIAAGKAPKDENGHGTFLAGIAAGGRDAAQGFSGVAGQAEIVVVKLKGAKQYLRDFYLLPERAAAYSETDIMLGIRYLIETGKRRNKPVVICCGVGTNSGNHTGNLALSRYLKGRAFDLNLCLITAAGNEGNAAHHCQVEVEAGRRAEAELLVGKEEKGFVMEIWMPSLSQVYVGLVSPSGERVERVAFLSGAAQRIPFVLSRTSVTVLYERQERASGEKLLLLRFEHPAEGVWRILLDGTQTGEWTIVQTKGQTKGQTMGRTIVRMYLPIADFLSGDTRFLAPEPEETICEPGNAALVMTVAGYNQENRGIYPASGRGFTADGQIKPDLAAPAVNILGPQAGGGFTVRSGTSISAAYVAGCAAVFWEYVLGYGNYYLDTVLLRDQLMMGASREPGDVYPNREWGYGTLNLFQVFEQLLVT